MRQCLVLRTASSFPSPVDGSSERSRWVPTGTVARLFIFYKLDLECFVLGRSYKLRGDKISHMRGMDAVCVLYKPILPLFDMHSPRERSQLGLAGCG